MESRISDSDERSQSSTHSHYVTTVGLPDHCTVVKHTASHMDGATSTPVCQPSAEDLDRKHDTPGNYQILDSCGLAAAAERWLDDAPPINSLPSLTNNQGIQQFQLENVGLPSTGSSIVSTAKAMLQQSLDSGSLLREVDKNEINRFRMESNVSSSNPVTATEINNIVGTLINSIESNTSSKDNTKQIVNLSKPNKPADSLPASSYLEMTAGTDIYERMADFSMMSAQKRNEVPSMSASNDLDRSEERLNNLVGAMALPKNISPQKHSLSINTDLSITSRKTVTKSTQTDSLPGQDQDSCGGASSEGVSVQTMGSGPASSLPSDEVLVRKLKRPVIQWLQMKLETQIGKAWQDLVDLHDWDYERITDFENSCAISGKSPFCKLLAEPEFQMYRLIDLKKDLNKLPRKDILHDLDDVMNKYYQ